MNRAYPSACVYLGVSVLFILLSGCGTVNVPLQVTHPAEINMAPSNQVGISQIRGNIGQAFADGLKHHHLALKGV